jgi:putative transposase
MVHRLFGNRRSTRLPEYDYRFGAFFITLVMENRIPLLGKIINQKVELSEEGKIVAEEWLRTPVIRKEITLDEWIVMPDHFHAIVIVDGSAANRNVGGACWRPCPSNEDQIQDDRERIRKIQPASHSLARMINQFKATTTRRIINELRSSPGIRIWQRGYDERIIRNEVELDKIRKYIRENPRNVR